MVYEMAASVQVTADRNEMTRRLWAKGSGLAQTRSEKGSEFGCDFGGDVAAVCEGGRVVDDGGAGHVEAEPWGCVDEWNVKFAGDSLFESHAVEVIGGELRHGSVRCR